MQPRALEAPKTLTDFVTSVGVTMSMGAQGCLILGEAHWAILMNVLAVACLTGGASAATVSFLGAGAMQCLGKKRASSFCTVGTTGWLENVEVKLQEGGGTTKTPYWLLKLNGKVIDRVHSLVCWWAHGPPCEGKDRACHFHCNRSLCLNPEHLSWGSAADNNYHTQWHKDKKRRRAHLDEVAPPKYKPHPFTC